MAIETQIVIERHEIDRWTEHSLVGPPDIAAQIRDVVALMSDYMTHPPRRLANHSGYSHVRMHSQAHRQHVGHHARRATRRRRHPAGKWNIHDDVLRAAQTVHENGGGGGH